MTQQYGLKEFSELMEKRLKECDDPMNIPFGCDPFSQSSINMRMRDKALYSYVLEMVPEPDPDAERYRKLRRWMSSNVAEGWDEVVKLGAVGAYVDWNSFDTQLDSLPVCNVGLCEVKSERP